MAKKHRRFGALHKALKDTGYKATDGPAGEYLKFLQGQNKITVARKPDSKYLVRFNVGVIPFDIEVPTGANDIKAYQGTTTVQANNILKVVTGLTDAMLGLERDLTKTREVAGFYPALAHVTVAATGQTKSPKTSGITKRSYKTINTRTGGLPYGRTKTSVKDPQGNAITDISNETEEDSRKAIMEAIKGKTFGNWICRGVTFTPELHPEAGFFGKSLANDAPTDIPSS